MIKLFTEKGSGIHAIDMSWVRPIITFNYYFHTYEVARYFAYQFYNHPACKHLYLKMFVARADGEHKETVCSVITKAELCEFVNRHKFNISESEIQNLIREDVVFQYHKFPCNDVLTAMPNARNKPPYIFENARTLNGTIDQIDALYLRVKNLIVAPSDWFYLKAEIAKLQEDADRWKQVTSNTNGLGLSVRTGRSHSVLHGAEAVKKVDSIRVAKGVSNGNKTLKDEQNES